MEPGSNSTNCCAARIAWALLAAQVASDKSSRTACCRTGFESVLKGLARPHTPFSRAPAAIVRADTLRTNRTVGGGLLSQEQRAVTNKKEAMRNIDNCSNEALKLLPHCEYRAYCARAPWPETLEAARARGFAGHFVNQAEFSCAAPGRIGATARSKCVRRRPDPDAGSRSAQAVVCRRGLSIRQGQRNSGRRRPVCLVRGKPSPG